MKFMLNEKIKKKYNEYVYDVKYMHLNTQKIYITQTMT